MGMGSVSSKGVSFVGDGFCRYVWFEGKIVPLLYSGVKTMPKSSCDCPGKNAGILGPGCTFHRSWDKVEKVHSRSMVGRQR